MTRFRTKRGEPTRYAYACGHVLTRDIRPRQGLIGSVTLWQEHGVYHVRRCAYGTDGPLTFARDWASFRTLSAARAHFARMVRT